MSKIRLYGSTSGYTELVPPAVAADNAITLPNTVGEAVVKDSSGDIRVNSINSGPLAGFRNAIINGNFDVWQRGTTFSGTGYGTDRWTAAPVGSTYSLSRQPFTIGQTDVPNQPTYFCRTVVTSVAGAGNKVNILQHIEGVRSFAGQQVTVSLWAKADAAKPIAIEFLQNFGTGGSPSTIVNSLGVTKTTLSTSWQKISATVTLPSISGKTIGSNGDDSLIFNIWFDAGSDFNSRTNSLGQQSGTFDIAQVQVEAGPVATPFERRPIQVEFELCERYYQICDYTNGGYVTGSVTIAGRAYYHTTMRTNPIATIYGYGVIGGAPATSAGVTINTGSNSYIQTFLATSAYYVNYGVYLNAEL